MDTTTIIFLSTTIVSTIGALVAIFQKNIRKSTCLGGSIEFKSDNNTPVPTIGSEETKTDTRSLPQINICQI